LALPLPPVNGTVTVPSVVVCAPRVKVAVAASCRTTVSRSLIAIVTGIRPLERIAFCELPPVPSVTVVTPAAVALEASAAAAAVIIRSAAAVVDCIDRFRRKCPIIFIPSPGDCEAHYSSVKGLSMGPFRLS